MADLLEGQRVVRVEASPTDGYRGVSVIEDSDSVDWEEIEELGLLSVEMDEPDLGFSKGLRAFSIHSNHLNEQRVESMGH